MPRKLYIDTCIFRDYLEGRKNVYGKDVSKPAASVFTRAFKKEFKLIISSFMLEELYPQINMSKSRFLFEWLKSRIETISYTDDDVEEAKRIDLENWRDALHGILAHRAGAECVVTRNVTDFACVRNLIQAKRPEEL